METLLLTRVDIERLLPMAECIAAVEEAMRCLGERSVQPPATLAWHTEKGGFHIKAGEWRGLFAAKTNGNFPSNPTTNGLPTIQGVVLLCDATDGRVLALMDSIELTARRTAAATAIAARILARPNSRVLTLVGCGVQARAHMSALREVLTLDRVLVYDHDAARARKFAEDVGAEAIEDLYGATMQSDVIVTCTTSHEFFLYPEHVRAGTFIAAVGVDNPQKKEIAPSLMQSATIVTDVTTQCAAIGDLHHAIEAGAKSVNDVRAELPWLLASRERGRTSEDEIIVFDSTGIGLQDVAAAVCVYESARNGKELRAVEFA